jgi:hypothetical protein
MFYALGLVFDGTEGVRSRFNVLLARNHFRRYRGRRVAFSCFVLPNSFLTVPRVSGPVFMFCAPGLVFDGSEGVGSHFNVLRARTRLGCTEGSGSRFSCFALPDSFSAVPRASRPVFMFCAPGLAFCETVGVGSGFHVLRALTHFRRYRRRWVSFSCFAFPGTFSAVRKASGPVFIFCVPGLVFDGSECVWSRFHVLCARTRFQRYQGH